MWGYRVLFDSRSQTSALCTMPYALLCSLFFALCSDAMHDLQRQIDALKQALQLDLPADVQAINRARLTNLQEQWNVMQSNIAVGNVIQGDLIQHVTIQQFFAGKPAPDQLELLRDYLTQLRRDCERLRLDRLTDKQYDGHEAALLPNKLQLSDVYTALATDEEIRIRGHTRCVKLEPLRQRLDLRSSNHVAAERVRSVLLAKPDLHDLHDDERMLVSLYRPELVLEAIARESRLVLLGDPGSGKSTALRYLAALLADALLVGKPHLTLRGWRTRAIPIPLLCPLGLVAAEIEQTRDDPTTALHNVLQRSIEHRKGMTERAGLSEYVGAALRDGTVIVLFDGLDEIPVKNAHGEPLRAHIAQALRDFERDVPNAKIVVTCRVRPYRELKDWQLREADGWTERMLAPWSFGQVRRFIQRWYTATAERDPILSHDEACQRASDLIAALETNQRVRTLTESPLLATMLALVHLNRKTLPADRAELYHECVELLLDRWEPQRSWASERPTLLQRLNIANLKREDLRGVLHRIAYQAHQQPPSSDGRGLIDGDQLEGQLYRFFERLKVDERDLASKKTIFLNALREETGLLHDLDGVYALPHLTFQEYLAACYVADLPNDDLKKAAYEAWNSTERERWREVLLLLMGRLRQQGKAGDQAISWIEFLMQEKIGRKRKNDEQRQRDMLFAAECYAEMGAAAALSTSTKDIDAIEERLEFGLAEILDMIPSLLTQDERIKAGALLANPLHDPRLLDPETGNSRDGKYWVEFPAGEYTLYLENGSTEIVNLPYTFKISRFPTTLVEVLQVLGIFKDKYNDNSSKDTKISSMHELDNAPYHFIGNDMLDLYCDSLNELSKQYKWVDSDLYIRLANNIESILMLSNKTVHSYKNYFDSVGVNFEESLIRTYDLSGLSFPYMTHIGGDKSLMHAVLLYLVIAPRGTGDE